MRLMSVDEANFPVLATAPAHIQLHFKMFQITMERWSRDHETEGNSALLGSTRLCSFTYCRCKAGDNIIMAENTLFNTI